jgi:hypothetical protein
MRRPTSLGITLVRRCGVVECVCIHVYVCGCGCACLCVVMCARGLLGQRSPTNQTNQTNPSTHTHTHIHTHIYTNKATDPPQKPKPNNNNNTNKTGKAWEEFLAHYTRPPCRTCQSPDGALRYVSLCMHSHVYIYPTTQQQIHHSFILSFIHPSTNPPLLIPPTHPHKHTHTHTTSTKASEWAAPAAAFPGTSTVS